MGEYVEINGHPTWVDQRGSGDKTILMMHGGLSNSVEGWILGQRAIANTVVDPMASSPTWDHNRGTETIEEVWR
jgi:hypothetical protein